MDHYSSEGSNIRVHSRSMSRGCARITKPPYTPPWGTCLFVNLVIILRVTDNKCMSSSDKCEYSKVDSSTFPYFASLSCAVHCFLLTPRVSVHLRRYIENLGMIHSVIINLLTSFLKTATIPTYQGISIAFPRYIAMQHPPSHDLIFMSYMFLLHWKRHTFAFIMIATSSLC